MNIIEYFKEKISFFYSFLGGAGLFLLKFLSLNILIEHTNFENYPFILLASGLFLFGFNRINKTFSNSLTLSTLYSIATIGFIIIGVDTFLAPLDPTFYNICVGGFFAFFISVSQYSEVTLKELTFNNNKSIKNSKLINKFIFFEELGLLAGASFLLNAEKYLNNNYTDYMVIIGIIPVGVMLFISSLAESPRIDPEQTQIKDDESSQKMLQTHFFVTFAILLTSSFLILKQVYSYGAYIGFKQLEQGGNDFKTVFSILNIVQTFLVFIIIGFKVFLQKNNVSWSNGIKWFLRLQLLVFAVLCLITSPVLLVSSSALRKLLSHTVLNEALKLLHLNYPNKIKVQIQHLVNSYAGFSAYLIIAVFAYLHAKEILPLQSIWIFGLVVTALAMYFKKRLVNSLVEYQVSSLLQSNVYEAMNSCYCLAHKEAALYAPTLGNLLNKKPRPLLSKAIIYTLGEMQSEASIDLLIHQYSETQREDIQLCIIEALLKFNSHKVDLFLLECLESMILNQVSLGEIRRTIFTSITNKIDSIAIPMSLRLLKSNQDNQRIIANLMLIIGELAVSRNDKSLFEILLQYTDDQYSRRIRSNAFLYLYTHKEYQRYAMSGISEYIVSNHEHDRSAAAFIAGELNLKGMYHYVKRLSFEKEGKNSTIEISLLKLEDPAAAKNIAHIILSEDRKASLTCLNQLNSIENDQCRYRVYNYILDHHPNQLGIFMKLLSDTNRNFDEDRRKIYLATKSRNIKMNDRDFLFSTEVQELEIDVSKNESKKEKAA